MGELGAVVFNEEGLFTFLANTKATGSIVRVGSYEIEGDKVIVNLPEYKDSKAIADAIENAEITLNGDTLEMNGISLDGGIVKAKKSSYEEYQGYLKYVQKLWESR